MTLTVGVLMSSGPQAVQDACAGLDGVRFVGMLEPSELAAQIDALDALIVSNDFYPPEVAALLRDGAPRLRWLQSSSTGFEHLLEEGVPTRLAFTEPGPVYSEIVAEHAVGLLLAFARGVLPMERFRAQRRWDRLAVVPTMFSLKDRTLLCIAFGTIGQEAARRARGFGMRVAAYVRRPPKPEVAALADEIVMPDGLHAALGRADAVLLGIPLTPETRRIIGAPELAAMRPHAILINMARGPVLDEAALIAALREKRIGGAALDVFEEEPLPEASPLWGFPNVIISPHLSAFGDTHGARAFGAVIRENVRRFVAREKLLNPVAGYCDTPAW
ncbi:MAG TPA: D-2-hydroxyacid dehydrogenase [Acetobacteraceae bacterium]|jgi:phosphoglycerate dehydrogenase-like enzyme|nr:D-2-hydroxyacid dehydrogenase [Acetobacteraceae bacterium]